MDKFLSDIECEFRDKYKDDLRQGTISRSFDFGDTFQNMLQLTEDAHKLEIKVPRLVVAKAGVHSVFAIQFQFKATMEMIWR